MKGGLLEAVVSEFDKDNAVTEISIPDETIDVSANSKDSRHGNGNKEGTTANGSKTETEKIINAIKYINTNRLSITNGNSVMTRDYFEENASDTNLLNNAENTNENLESGKPRDDDWKQRNRNNGRADIKKSVTFDGEEGILTGKTETALTKQKERCELQACQVTVTENSNGPDHASEPSHRMENNSHLSLSYGPSIEKPDDLSGNTNEAERGLLSDEDLQTDPNRSHEVAKLTRANLKEHSKILKEHSSTQLKDDHTEMANNSVANVTEEELINIANEFSASESGPNASNETPKNKTVSEILNTDVEYIVKSESKSTNGSITQFPQTVNPLSSKPPLSDAVRVPKQPKAANVNNASSSHSTQRQHHSSIKKSPVSNSKRAGKNKQKNSLDDVETLVEREKRSKSGNRKRSKIKKKEMESKRETIMEDSKLKTDDSGIEKDEEENEDLGEKVNIENSAKHHKDNGIDEGPAFVHKRLLQRTRQRQFQKRPVYDTTNTSTSMILLNNKYGKHSRLWKSQENHLDRAKLINPQRHLKEPSFYLSGNFHSRCSTSKSQRSYFSTPNIKFDFSDRPDSDKIGDRLYEARVSVNQQRHRSCRCDLPPVPKPLNFSPLTPQERSNRYVFAWERLYASPLVRPATSRPHSMLSGKKIGMRVVKIPQAMPTLPTKETILGQST